jgi:hypothetical protein
MPDELARDLRADQEERLVDVVDVARCDKFAVNTIRGDTGEIVATRGMTEVERELHRKWRGQKSSGRCSA